MYLKNHPRPKSWPRYLATNRPRVLWIAILIPLLTATALFRANILEGHFFITHDTITYTNLPGARAGFSLTNFSSDLRTPGYSLFLSMVTAGEIPNPDVIQYVMCGDSVFGKNVDCNVAASDSGGNSVSIQMPPDVYSFSLRTAELFQRTTLVTRLLFAASLLFLYWTLSFWINPALSLLTVLFVCYYINFDSLFGIATESLYPTLPFLYVSCLMMYLACSKGRWILFASVICSYSFLVRPVFIYLSILHLTLLCFFIWHRNSRMSL